MPKKTSNSKLGLFNILMLVFNTGVIAAIILSYLSSHLSTDKSWILPFFGLGYPFLLILNLFFMIYWMFRKRWYFLFSLITLLAGWNHITRTFRVDFGGEPVIAGETFKIISYNVKNLSNDNVDLVEPEIRSKIIRFLDAQDADLLCLQEFAVVHPNPDGFIDSLSTLLETPYHAHSLYLTRPRQLMDAIIIFSRFPIINSGPINRDNVRNYGLFADLIIDKDTVRVLNVHLASVRLRHEDYQFISNFDLQFGKNEKIQESSKRIVQKLRTAFAIRSDQVNHLAGYIEHSPYPLILTGDFNDSPNSYTYQQLTRNLQDVFLEHGQGFGNTYIGNLPSFRIDYILYSKYFKSVGYRREPVRYSDHYPIVAELIKR